MQGSERACNATDAMDHRAPAFAVTLGAPSLSANPPGDGGPRSSNIPQPRPRRATQSAVWPSSLWPTPRASPSLA